MPKFMRRGSLGRLVETDDAADPDLEEVRLTVEECRRLQRLISSYKQEVAEAKEDGDAREKAAREAGRARARSAREEADRRCREYERQADAEAMRKVSETQAALAEAERRTAQVEAERDRIAGDLERQKGLNWSLKRIATERANAQRGLTPKKRHNGYVVLHSSQYRQKHRVGGGEDGGDGGKGGTSHNEYANVWHTVIQTPYEARLPLDFIEYEIWHDLWDSVLPQLGCRYMQEYEDNGEYRTWTAKDENGEEKEVCGLYKWSYSANFKAGLWEVDLYHTKELKVPMEYLPQNRKKQA